MRLNLFDVLEGVGEHAEKPRNVTAAELRAYLCWLAERAGIDHEAIGVELSPSGVWVDKVCVVPMPGYGNQPHPICEILNEDGTVERSFALPIDKRGNLPMDKAQVLKWTGLPKVKATRAKRAPAQEPVAAPVIVAATVAPEPLISLPAPGSVETAAIPAPVATTAPDPVSGAAMAALVARIEALESAAVVRAALIRAAANDDAPHRAPRAVRERIARRYLGMRRQREEMREAQRQLARQYETGLEQFEALKMAKRVSDRHCDAAVAERDAARGQLWNVQNQLQGATGRADRLARFAREQRKLLSRNVEDLRGARAEARVLSRRVDEMRGQRAALTPRQAAPPPTDTIMARAFAGAR